MEQVVARISDLLEQAKNLTEDALNLGREHGVPVDLDALGISEDMWYVDEISYRNDYIQNNYSNYNTDTHDYDVPELTPEQLAEIEEHMTAVRESGGYDDNYKVLGWMNSSTNC